jgi:hypothetical protein
MGLVVSVAASSGCVVDREGHLRPDDGEAEVEHGRIEAAKARVAKQRQDTAARAAADRAKAEAERAQAELAWRDFLGGLDTCKTDALETASAAIGRLYAEVTRCQDAQRAAMSVVAQSDCRQGVSGLDVAIASLAGFSGNGDQVLERSERARGRRSADCRADREWAAQLLRDAVNACVGRNEMMIRRIRDQVAVCRSPQPTP